MPTALGRDRRHITTTDARALPEIVNDRVVVTESGAYELFTASELLTLLGIPDVDNVSAAALRDRTTHTGTQSSSTIADFAEAAQDAIADLLTGTSGVSLSYDDEANELTITGGGSGGLDAEQVRDAIGVALLGTGLITVTVNDGLDTITVSTTATQNDTDANLKNRANHSGAQAISTITGLQDALDALLPESLFTAANDILVGTGAGAATALSVPASRILANVGAGLVAATAAQIKTLLAIAISDVTSLQTELDAKALKTPTVGTSLGTSGTVDLDLAALNGTVQWITASGNLSFTTSNRAAGRGLRLFIDADGSSRTLSWPSWTAHGAALPTSLASGKRLAVTILALGTTEASISAATAAQP